MTDESNPEQHPFITKVVGRAKKTKRKKLANARRVRKLTPSKQRYVKALVVPGTKPRDAARSVGLDKVPGGKRVEQAVQREIQQQLKHYELKAEDVILELRRMAFFDIRELYRDDGTIKHVMELDEDTARALVGLDVEAMFEGKGQDREVVGYIRKYKTAKKEALEMLMKHLGKLSGDGSGNKDRLAEVIAALREPE